MNERTLIINLPLVNVDRPPKLIINLPMDVMVVAELLEACPVGAWARGTEDGQAILVYWDDAAEKGQLREEAEEDA